MKKPKKSEDKIKYPKIPAKDLENIELDDLDEIDEALKVDSDWNDDVEGNPLLDER
jgi:hypothetical protein